MKKIYIAGPMSGIPSFNYPAFDAAAKALREAGFDVISPAEMDNGTVRRIAMASPDGNLKDWERVAGTTWGQTLARDVLIIADDCSAIVLLPNWWMSRGARLEATVGLLCNHDFYFFDSEDEIAIPLPREYVVDLLSESWN